MVVLIVVVCGSFSGCVVMLVVLVVVVVGVVVGGFVVVGRCVGFGDVVMGGVSGGGV